MMHLVTAVDIAPVALQHLIALDPISHYAWGWQPSGATDAVCHKLHQWAHRDARTKPLLLSSSGLTVVTVMAITTVFLALVMLLVWGWRLLPVLAVCGPLLALELAILAASLPKVAEGAWVALLVAAVVTAVMLVWW
jgi:ABC-type multidrug transport system fused ATPase/permease subunit